MHFKVHMKLRFAICMTASALSLAACTVLPTGPSVPALPGSGKSFDQFQGDDGECQRYARAQSASAASASSEAYELQRRYDFAYVQCMYSRGHKVPVPAAYTAAPPPTFIPPPSPPAPEPETK